MTNSWDPLAQPPAGASLEDQLRWKFDHIAAFQQAHPDRPQGKWAKLKVRDRRLLLADYDVAVAIAERGGPLPPELEKAIRTGTLTLPSSATARKRVKK